MIATDALSPSPSARAAGMSWAVANYFFDYLPEGPIIVAALLGQFGVALGVKRFV